MNLKKGLDYLRSNLSTEAIIDPSKFKALVDGALDALDVPQPEAAKAPVSFKEALQAQMELLLTSVKHLNATVAEFGAGMDHEPEMLRTANVGGLELSLARAFEYLVKNSIVVQQVAETEYRLYFTKTHKVYGPFQSVEMLVISAYNAGLTGVEDGLQEGILDVGYQAPSRDSQTDRNAVEMMARAMLNKLIQCRRRGYGGWANVEDCSNERLSSLLLQAVFSEDPVDVANYAMMIHARGERINLHRSVAVPPGESGDFRRNVAAAVLATQERTKMRLLEAIPTDGSLNPAQLKLILDEAFS